MHLLYSLSIQIGKHAPDPYTFTLLLENLPLILIPDKGKVGGLPPL